MYYQNYEDYMRSVLGYPIEAQNTYASYDYSEIPYERAQMQSDSIAYSSEVMDLYPDIYKIVNPMVCKICEANTKPITRELIDQMTDEIYLNLESQPEFDTVINVRVNTPPSDTEKLRTSNMTSSNSSSAQKSKTTSEKVENRENREEMEDRQRRPNTTLRDLIRILILNRLLGGGFFPGRPPRPRPPRPPMRPPFTRDDRYYDGYFKF